GPGAGLAYARPAGGRPGPGGGRGDRPGAGRRAAPDDRRPGAGAGGPGGRDRRGRAPYRSPRRARGAVGSGGEPALQRGGAGAAAPAGRAAVAAAGAGHGPGRGGGPDVRAAGVTGVRHAVGEAGLVRRGPPGRAGAAQRVLAGAERGFPARRVHPAGSAGYRGEPRGGVRGRRRGLPAAAQDAARRAVRLGRLGAGGRTAAPGGRSRPWCPRRIARYRAVRPAGCVAPLNTTGRTAYDFTIVTGVTVRVPAKLNLQLAVGPPRADGYHDLVTVYHAVSLFDEITAAPARRDGVSVSGEGADRVPADGDNLALRAVAALRAEVPSAPGVHITIAKRIPVAAGLAGGSGDAAAALVACNELWSGGFGPPQLGGIAVGRGRGEQLTPALAPATQYHWVLAFADGHLSTPEVYAALDRQRAR